MGSYDIMIEISEHVTIVHLMHFSFNVKHEISVVGHWIFESNYEKSLVLNRELLDMISAPSVGEKRVAVSETVFISVRYILSAAHLKKK